MWILFRDSAMDHCNIWLKVFNCSVKEAVHMAYTVFP